MTAPASIPPELKHAMSQMPAGPAAEDDPAQAWSARGILVFGFCAVALLVLGLGGWAALARIDGAVVASGQVQVEQNRQMVAHRDGGEVAKVHVREGQNVAAGDLLLSLSSSEIDTAIAVADAQFYEFLARAARLSAERDGLDRITLPDELSTAMADSQAIRDLALGQQNLFDARRQTAQAEIAQLDKRRGQIAVQIDSLTAQGQAMSEQLALAEEDLAAQESLLARGLAQQSRVIALRREVVGLAAEIGRLAASRAQAEVQQTEVELAMLKSGSDRREAAIAELRDIDASLAGLREERAGLYARQARLAMRAPTAGVIYDLAVFGPGAVVSPAQPVLFIVPQDRPLIISARVNPIHIDQIYPGQPVRLRFTTFDQRNTPELDGTILRVSPDAFTDEATGAAYYRAEITLPEEQRARLPEGATLIPGMPVEAFISTGERTALAYLTRPLADYFTRAFRED